MTTYVFETPDGQEIEAQFPMGKAPRSIRRNGVRCKRKVVVPLTTAATRPSLDTGYHRSFSLPRWWPFAPRHDKDGTPLFASYNEIREAEAKAKDDGEAVKYDR